MRKDASSWRREGSDRARAAGNGPAGLAALSAGWFTWHVDQMARGNSAVIQSMLAVGVDAGRVAAALSTVERLA